MAPKLGIVAGRGELPLRIANICRSTGRDFFVLALEGQADPADYAGFDSVAVTMGEAGRAIRVLREAGVSELTFAGKVSRPPMRAIKPDLRAARFLGRIALRSWGDDRLLRAISDELEREGFRVVSPSSVLGESSIAVGPAGVHVPDEDALGDIARGMEVATALGRADAGQSVVVQQGVVLAIEADEGTDAMLARAGTLRREGPGGVLVKISKPQQERRMDPPVIGPPTMRNALSAGLRGIAVESGVTIVLDRDEVIAEADASGLFLTGVERASPD